MQKLYFQLEESEQVSIKLIDWIQYFRLIVNNYDRKKVNIIASLNGMIFLFRQYIASTNVRHENLCLKKFSIQKLVKNAVRRLEDIAKEKDIKINYNFQYKMKDIVIGNSDHLQAILSQLIGSVIRFNHSCQVIITVHLFTIKNYIKSDNILQFRIHDTGSGISKEKLGNIKAKLADFELVRDYPLMLESGLWFVNYLINQLNGEMEIESEKDKFTTITCNIPVQLF